MRLWTLHPSYLDAQGLVALWREGLLAQKVLQGGTRGYRHHPQLVRFRESADPLAAISTYLCGVLEEAAYRGYAFDASKIVAAARHDAIPVTDGQLAYEWRHLKAKLKVRDPQRCRQCRSIRTPAPHPLFHIIAGNIACWERT